MAGTDVHPYKELIGFGVCMTFRTCPSYFSFAFAVAWQDYA